MFPPHPTDLLHTILRGQIHEGDIAIDATAGNGHDTLFLAREVGDNGRIVAFDIQDAATSATRRKLEGENLAHRVSLHCASHCGIASHAEPGSVRVIIFNLGYLPGADRKIATETAGTLEALGASVPLLQPGGILAAVCYPGHAEGAVESEAVENFFHSLPNHRVARYSLVATRGPAPFLLLARNGRKATGQAPRSILDPIRNPA